MDNAQFLQEYSGVDINVGDYVFYNNGLKFFGNHKKNIWLVDSVDGSKATVKNILSGNKFNTNVKQLVNIRYLQNWDGLNEKYVNKEALAKYNEITEGDEDNEINDYESITQNDLELARLRMERQRMENHVWDSSRYFKSAEIDKFFNKIKEKEMNQMTRVMNQNIDAAKDGALIAAGKTLNTVVKGRIAEAAPRKYRKLINHSIADIVVANVASFAVQNFAAQNQKAVLAADAMMRAAMVEFISSFNFEKIITDTLANVDLDSLISE
jgi:hypothetical protein